MSGDNPWVLSAKHVRIALRKAVSLSLSWRCLSLAPFCLSHASALMALSELAYTGKVLFWCHRLFILLLNFFFSCLTKKGAAVTIDKLIDMVMAKYDNIITTVNNNNLTSYSWCHTAGMIDL